MDNYLLRKNSVKSYLIKRKLILKNKFNKIGK